MWVIIGLVFCISTAFAEVTECYSCFDSTTSCRDASNLNKVTCKSTIRQYVQSIDTKAMSSSSASVDTKVVDIYNQYLNGIQNIEYACAKAHLYDRREQVNLTLRTCTLVDTQSPNCNWLTYQYGNNGRYRFYDCDTCDENLCNSSTMFKTSGFIALLLLAVIIKL